MAIEGELVVRVASASGRVTRATASAERPRVAGRLFPGRAASEVPALAGALFAICGRSQAITSEAAIELARGQSPAPRARNARDVRIAAETIHEHAWRLLVDWPKLAGQAPAVALLAQGRRVLAPLLEACEGEDVGPARDEAIIWARDAIYGGPHASFLALDTIDGLRRWMVSAATPVATLAQDLLADRAPLGASDVGFLPFGADRWVERALAPAIDGDAGFDDVPHLQGAARETGPLARMAGHPLADAAIRAWGKGVGARFVARLLETAAALEAFGGRHGAVALGEDSAIAWVDTARGLLVHRVQVEGERIAAYRIVAPTEWNFHPDGAFTRGALALAADDAARLESSVRWIVASLDPCIGVRYEARHA
jgi:coenzyme F420-reducing hydrogenase alpha subunit